MASRNIMDCEPKLRELWKQFDFKMKASGLAYIITCTARSVKEQMALYAQGRQELDEVNKLRLICNLPPLTEDQNKNCVTWTLFSQHLVDLTDYRIDNNLSKAFDIALVYPKNPKKVYYDLKVDIDKDDVKDYEEAARIGESVGLIAGMRFKKKNGSPNPDPAHFEMPITPLQLVA